MLGFTMIGPMMLERMLREKDRREVSLYDMEKARQVARDVHEIVTHLRTSRSDKEHGEYLNYDDDKLSIRYDTWGRNCSIRVGSGDDRQAVYKVTAGATKRPGVFKTGLWIDYLHNVLLPRAEEQKRLKEIRKAEEVAERNRRNYGEVDDAALFADVREVSV